MNTHDQAAVHHRDPGQVAQGGWRVLGSKLAVASFLLGLAGCSLLPQPQTDPTRFYLLSSSTTAAPVEAVATAPALHLRPVEMASYLRSRPLIIRRGDNEVEFREYARWGEPLELGIGRVLREELLERGAASAVRTGAIVRPSEAASELSVRVLAFEGTASGDVIFRAVWEIMPTGSEKTVSAHGTYRASGLQWDGKDEASLAAQLSKAVTGLADDIAAQLGKAK